jgi:hypothetical protein
VSPRACGVGLCGGTLSSPVFKNVVVSVPAFQPRDDLGGSGWKPAQTHSQAISGSRSWNTQWHSECSSLFQCSSSGSAWTASKGGRHWAWQPVGSNHTVARSRSAPPAQIRLVGGPSAGGSTSQHRSRSWPTKLWAEDSPLRRHMTLAHWHTEVFHWHTCATEVCQTKSSRSGLKLTLHRFSARSDEVEKSWHTGTPKSHQPCCTADHVGAKMLPRACGAHSVWRLFFFFSVKKRDTGVPVCQPGDDLRRWCWKPAQTNFQAI